MKVRAHPIECLSIERRIRLSLVVLTQPCPNVSTRVRTVLKGMQVDTFIFEVSLQPFDEHIIHLPTFAIHITALGVELMELRFVLGLALLQLPLKTHLHHGQGFMVPAMNDGGMYAIFPSQHRLHGMQSTPPWP